jgi:prepilin-type processing-associated H-X9-DG protein
VEVSDSGIDWMEPKDLTLDEALAGINPREARGISSRHSRGAYVAFPDGSVDHLPQTLSDDALEAFLTRDLDETSIREVIADAEDEAADASTRDDLFRLIAWLASLLILAVHGVLVDAGDRRRKARLPTCLGPDCGPRGSGESETSAVGGDCG